MKVIRVNAKVIWVIFQDQRSRYWVGTCEALKISSQGETHSELVENIEDALATLMRDLIKNHELERFLKEQQWTLDGELPNEPSEARFEIPYKIERRSQHDLEVAVGEQAARDGLWICRAHQAHGTV